MREDDLFISTSGESSAARPVNKEVAEYISRIRRADGELIPLPGKTSRLEEPLYISARYGKSPETGDEDEYLIIDVIAQRGEKYIPVGMKDYKIHEEIAESRFNAHTLLPATNDAHREADARWGGKDALSVESMKLDQAVDQTRIEEEIARLRERGIVTDEQTPATPVYRGLGIAKLLVASSILILEEKGIKEVEFGEIDTAAQGVWNRFGGREWSTVPLTELTKSPNIIPSIETFLTVKK